MDKFRRKTKLSILSYVMAFICVTSWIALGVVLALTSANINIGGNISFTATDIYADITGSVTGTATTNTLTDIHLTSDMDSFTTPSSWSNINFDFVKGQDIVFTINITNKSSERPFWIAFTNSVTDTNIVVSRKIDGSTVSTFETTEVAKSSTKVIEITMSLYNKNKSVSGTFNLGLNLTNDKPDTINDISQYAGVFEFNVLSEGYATIEGCYVYTGDIYIPAKIKINNVVHSIVGISSTFSHLGMGLGTPANVSVHMPATVVEIFTGALNNSAIVKLYFEDPNGWAYINSSGESTSVSSDILSDPTRAISEFKHDFEYQKNGGYASLGS